MSVGTVASGEDGAMERGNQKTTLSACPFASVCSHAPVHLRGPVLNATISGRCNGFNHGIPNTVTSRLRQVRAWDCPLLPRAASHLPPPAPPPTPHPRHCVQDRGLTGGRGQPEVRCWVIDGPARVNTRGSLSMLVRGLSASVPPPPPPPHLFHPSPPSALCRQPGGNGSSRKFGQIVPLFVAFCSILQHASYHKPFSKLCHSKHVSEIT